MIFFRQVVVTTTVVLSLVGCDARVETGRNAEPRQKQKMNDDPEQKDPGHKDPGQPGPNPSQDQEKKDPAEPPKIIQGDACFDTESKNILPSLKKICDETIHTNPLLAKLDDYVCSRGRLIAVLDQPSCGWKGDAAKMRNFARFYEQESNPEKNYYDIHSTMVNPPVKVDRYLHFIRLAFENYPEFKRQGFRWLAGTREQTNMNQGNLESGVDYKFRVEKDIYELGYNAHIKLYKLSDHVWMHINYADSGFTRVLSFAQIAFYAAQKDGSTLVLKLEHRTVESRGLFQRAKTSAVELLTDFMQSSWDNALRSHSMGG